MEGSGYFWSRCSGGPGEFRRTHLKAQRPWIWFQEMEEVERKRGACGKGSEKSPPLLGVLEQRETRLR